MTRVPAGGTAQQRPRRRRLQRQDAKEQRLLKAGHRTVLRPDQIIIESLWLHICDEPTSLTLVQTPVNQQ